MTAALPPTPAPPLGYRSDVAALRDRLSRHAADADPGSPTAVTEVLTLRHRLISLTGALPGDLMALGDAVDAAVERFPTWPDLRLMAATVALALHRVAAARSALAAVPPDVVAEPPAQVLIGDLRQACGEYAAARADYLAAARLDPQWSTSARLAALAVATGDLAEAERRYDEAEDGLSAKQMRAFAWVRAHRGDLARAVGDLPRAAACYDDAETACPGWWLVTGRRAALDLARGRPDDAIQGYRAVLAEVDGPESREALGTALAAAGRTREAVECHRAALAAYTASAERGEVHYLHHLAAFHADVRPDPPVAVAWARRDVAVRRNGSTLSMLAWCLHRAGRSAEAWRTVQEAFSLGAGDPLLRSRARVIEDFGG